MKFLAAITSLILYLYPSETHASTADDESLTPSLRGKDTERELVDNNIFDSAVHNSTKGMIRDNGNFGNIDISNIASAQAGAKGILESLRIVSSSNLSQESLAKRLLFQKTPTPITFASDSKFTAWTSKA